MDTTPFYQAVPTDYLCELHSAPATCFLAHEDGSASFYCPGCQPKNPALNQDCHSVAKLQLFKALRSNAAELRKRKEQFLQASDFLSALYLRHTEVHDKSHALIERLYTLYTKASSLRSQTFDSLYSELKQEIETVYDKPVYRLTNLGTAVVHQSPDSARKVAADFFRVPLCEELEALLPRCEEPLRKTRPAYYKELNKDLYERVHSSLPLKSYQSGDAVSLPVQDEYTGEYNGSGQKHGQGKCLQRNGDVYEGDWRFDHKNGVGTLVTRSGDRYEGAWSNGEMHGIGAISWANGLRYCGRFEHDKPTSMWSFWKLSYKGAPLSVIVCVLLFIAALSSCIYAAFDGQCVIHGLEYQQFADGYYHGEFLSSARHGEGTFLWSSGAVYVGQWAFDQRHGHGLLVDSSKNWHMGDFQHDSFYQGRSGIFLENGDFYVGESKQGERFGQGFYFAANGTVFVGSWAKDLITGIGASPAAGFLYLGNFSGSGFTLMSYDNRDIYIGEAYAGKRQGKGIYLWPNGDFHSGTWDSDRQSGQGIFYSADTCLVGTFYNGTFDTGFGTKDIGEDQYYGGFQQGGRHGQGALVTANGSVLTGVWQADALTGLGLGFQHDGGFERGFFADSKLQLGSGLIFSSEGVYFGDLRDGMRRGNGTFVGGNWSYTGEWRDHLPHGKGFRALLAGDFQQGRFQSGALASGLALHTVSDTERYFGGMSLHGYHGQGTHTWDNDTVYVGDWHNGKMHGNGVMAKAGKMLYSGPFVNGSSTHGKGLMTLSNGDVFFGGLEAGNFEGSGHYLWGNHSAYIGQWKQGKRHGSGLLIDLNSGLKKGNFSANTFTEGLVLQTNNNTYYGEYKRGNTGEGIYLWNNGALYMGSWKDGFMTGSGLYLQPNRSFKRGRFDSNVFAEGTAMLLYQDGKVYIGDVLGGFCHGEGILLGSSGSIFTGNWTYGKQLGQGFAALPNYDFLVGEFSGQLLESGKALVTYENGDKFYGQIEGGRRMGCGAYLWKNGTMYSGNWVHEEIEGKAFVVRFDENTCAGELKQSSLPASAALLSLVSLILV